MTNIKISDFSQEAASKTKGLELRSQMEPLLKSGTPFSVDFDGIARLALIYGFDAIRGISKLNLSETGNLAFTTSIENAQLLSANPDYTDQIKDIINQNLPKKED